MVDDVAGTGSDDGDDASEGVSADDNDTESESFIDGLSTTSLACCVSIGRGSNCGLVVCVICVGTSSAPNVPNASNDEEACGSTGDGEEDA